MAALVFLFGALALPWDGTEDGSGRWWVVIAIIVSATSLAAPYVVSAGIVPGWGGPQVTLLKLACAAPLVVSVFAAIVNELVHVSDSFDGYFSFIPSTGIFGIEGGIGAGVGVALAGALFAAQPRASEMVPGSSATPLWRPLAIGLLAAGSVLLTVTTLIKFATSVGDDFTDFSDLLGALVLVQVTMIIAMAFALPPVLRGSREWARVLGVAGVTLIAVQFLGGASEDPMFLGLVVEKFQSGSGAFLLAGGVAAVLARPVLDSLHTIDPVSSWVKTAGNACVLLATLLGVSAVARILTMIGDEAQAAEIIQVVVMLFAAGVALAARTLLANDPSQARPAVIGILGGILLAAVVAIAVGNSADGGDITVTGEAIAWFGMPALALWSLLYPSAIRETFKPLAAPKAPPSA